jgi:putative molybdopterin biosynthesis protein
LLDFHLEKLQINPDEIQGTIENTLHGVAVAVASGRADCGLGIAAAANRWSWISYSLDKEEYELNLS